MAETVTASALQAGGVVPDILPASHPSLSASSPLLPLPLTWESSSTSASLGATLTPTATQQPPRVSLPASAPAAGFYTVIALDADPPSRRRPRFRAFLHLLQVNIPAGTIDLTTAGTTLAPYLPPGPPQGSGKHRYVFLLYHHSSSVDTSKLPSHSGMSGRGKQSVEGLERLLRDAGSASVDLVAVNWFEAEWDEQVDRYMKQTFGWMATPARWMTSWLI